MALFRCGAGEAFDISTIPAGSCGHGASNSGTSGYSIDNIESQTTMLASGATSTQSVSGLVNAEGFSTLTLRGSNCCTAFGLNPDGTFTMLYGQRIQSGSTNVHTITTTGYKYVFWSTGYETSAAVTAQIA